MIQSPQFKNDNDAYLRGYRFGAANVRVLAGIETVERASAIFETKKQVTEDHIIIGVRSVQADKTTRYALGKGRVKFVVSHAVDQFRYAGKVESDPYMAGYIDAFLDSIN